MLRPLAAALIAIAGGLPARAEGPVVVELFTSQGCSACPAADRMLAKLAGHDDVLALALHVDYWDYIGWEDVFADPAYTKRQKAYAHAVGERMIYTPQMVVQGEERIVGTSPAELMEAIGAHAGEDGRVALEARREGGSVRGEARGRRRRSTRRWWCSSCATSPTARWPSPMARTRATRSTTPTS